MSRNEIACCSLNVCRLIYLVNSMKMTERRENDEDENSNKFVSAICEELTLVRTAG